MEDFIIYTLTTIFLGGILLTLLFEWITSAEHRKLAKALRDGQECKATILNVTSITPTLFNMANVRITAEIWRANEKPSIIRFKYEATYPEWQKLHTGRIVTIDINPHNPKSVLLNDSQPANERQYFAGRYRELEAAFTE
jgi:hypothetical protein